jgi:hypothetical protein
VELAIKARTTSGARQSVAVASGTRAASGKCETCQARDFAGFES